MRALLLALALLGAGPARAEAPGESLRPEARAVAAAGRPEPRSAAREGAAMPVARPAPRPAPRPAASPVAPPKAPPVAPALVPGEGVTALAVLLAVLPPRRPEGVSARAEAATAEAARGQVCGNPLIQGSAEASFGSAGGCGIESPVRVRSLDGVSLSTPALMDCATAEALLLWVQRGARPALAGRGGGLARLDLMGDYACRTRNNQAGARLSEHGRGRAVDVGGLTLADGSQVVVARDWPGQGLREMAGAACGPFSTVLGPEADSFHADNLHLDTARGRGPYCR